jgi:N-acetylated-alpha-linked acidic dipeptidase
MVSFPEISSLNQSYLFMKIGSTEWVEQNLINLGSKAVAYLNVDCAVQGPGFFVGSTPQLDSLILEITKKVFK